MKLLVFTFLLIMASCMKNDLSPEAALKDFVDSRADTSHDNMEAPKRVFTLCNLKNVNLFTWQSCRLMSTALNWRLKFSPCFKRWCLLH